MTLVERNWTIPEHCAGARLDQVLAELGPEYSRARWQAWIKGGQVRVDGAAGSAKQRVRGGERITVAAELQVVLADAAQDLPLTVLYEDAAVLVVDKPAGLVVHPAAGHADGTLVNALLHLDPGLGRLPRAGIVHRLDKDTTGCLLVARTAAAHHALVAQLAARTIGREYEAVVVGVPVAGGTIAEPIGRHPVERKKQAVTAGGRPAVTHVRVLERFRAHALLRCTLETGRTHQIRVHLAHAGFPILGDPLYGGRFRRPPDTAPDLVEHLRRFPRQALHARRLRFRHPAGTGEVEVVSPRPADLEALIDDLRRDREERDG